MINFLKQNTLAIFSSTLLVLVMFIITFFFLNNLKEKEKQAFKKQQEEKITELENIILSYNKENLYKLQTSERIFFDKINTTNIISKSINDSIYIDLLKDGITQKVKISNLKINNSNLYLNNKFLNKSRYITNTYISIWQKSKKGYIRIASSKAGLTNDEIPIILKESTSIIKNIEEGKHFIHREYTKFDSELSVFVPLFINSKLEACVQFSIPEFIPATIGKIYKNNSGFFLIKKNDAKLIANNKLFKLDEDEFLVKKILSLKDKRNNFNYNNYIFFVSYYPEMQLYIGFVYGDEIFKDYYSLRKSILSWFIFISLVIILSFLLFSYFLKQNNSKNIYKIKDLLKLKHTDKYKDDTIFEKLNNFYLDFSKNITKLSKGKTEINISDDFIDNEINIALLNISKLLKDSKTEKEEQEAQSILKAELDRGVAEITNLLQHVTNLKDLSFNVLKAITNFLGIQQGAIFILNDTDKENPLLEMSASYAYDKRRNTYKIIKVKEGLVGRAYLEKESIYITEVPKNYTLIESGFGETEPKFLLIVPLIFNNKVQAVIELGGIEEIKDYKIKFVESIGENIASTISNLKHSKQTEELLSQTRVQAKEIEEQRKTLEEKINTHRRQNRKLDKEMLQLIEIIESIKSVSYMFEYDLNGNIVDVSKKVLDLWGIKKKDIIDKHHKGIIGLSNYDETYSNFWSELNENKSQTISETISINGKEYTFIQNYVPIKNVRRKIFRYLSLGTLKS